MNILLHQKNSRLGDFYDSDDELNGKRKNPTFKAF